MNSQVWAYIVCIASMVGTVLLSWLSENRIARRCAAMEDALAKSEALRASHRAFLEKSDAGSDDRVTRMEACVTRYEAIQDRWEQLAGVEGEGRLVAVTFTTMHTKPTEPVDEGADVDPVERVTFERRDASIPGDQLKVTDIVMRNAKGEREGPELRSERT